jgi:hypothetical protein
MFTLEKRQTISPLGHSADVSLWLHVGGQKLSLAQTSRAFIKLNSDADVPPGPARIELIIDGESHFSNVTITGTQADGRWANIAD